LAAVTLANRFSGAVAAYDEAVAHPLSARKILLACVLLDDFADRVFEDRRDTPAAIGGAADGLAWRARLRAASPALARIFELCALSPDGPRLVTSTVEVPLADYPRLPVWDYMVSLYNANTVQRVMLVGPGETARPALEVLAEAIAWWREAGGMG
jgi:hypothetical protein